MSPLMLSRRATLASLAALAVQAGPLRAQTAKKVSVALDWTANTNHIGLFVARDKGFYRQAGIEATILPYTDTSAGTLVASGVADFGILGSIALLTQRTAGADLVGTYAVVQTETGRVVFKGSREDINRPKDLDGKTYGGFGSAWENALISSIIRNDGGKGEFETVTLGTSAYQALENGSVDFTLEVYTWEGVKAEIEGLNQRAFRYADFGVPDEHTTLIGSSRAFLKANPASAKAFLQATQQGYRYAVDHPDEATDLLISANSDALTDRKLVRSSLQALIDGKYLMSAEGRIGDIDPAKFEAIGNYAYKSNILKGQGGSALTAVPDFAGYFTNEFLAGS
ncbi:ABC transporter substrate-binding protein [Neorhizobium sp. NCHU2750]|uniref:ABC transporter substrate-binding protein n=1 Tax=Neorhizobium sp. NCHU2750 TaxID=1825976 RepID=UPI000E74F3F7|nr:ABC transporter ATP-binding protein [Neorhizobium sp. NCHU2750]